tara:strand:- start:6 stop:617 length:612 start_codon:yes stop_codon:yes gene_type:complete
MRMVLLAGAALILAACDQGERRFEARDLEFDNQANGASKGDPTVNEPGPADAAQSTASPTARPVACASDEQELFSCTAGAKRIAVCGVTNTQGQKTAQYRFGSPDKAEIVLDGGRFASVPYSGGGEAQIEFANGATRYVVYSRTVRTNFDERGNMPEFTDGVVVLRDGEAVADRQCTGDAESIDIMAGEAYGGVASELFHYGD